MRTERSRELFAQYLEKQGIRNMLVCDSSLTINQDSQLKYERIDKYRVSFLDNRELKNLMKFCEKYGIVVWFGADKLCIGFNNRGCQKLSSYNSVPLHERDPDIPEDRKKVSVASNIIPGIPLEDIIDHCHYLDVHGGVDWWPAPRLL